PPRSTLFPYTTLFRSQLVHEELQQNPLLEEVSKDDAPRVEMEGGDESGVADERGEKNDKEFKEEFEALSKLDEEWREYFSQTNTDRKSTRLNSSHDQI